LLSVFDCKLNIFILILISITQNKQKIAKKETDKRDNASKGWYEQTVDLLKKMCFKLEDVVASVDTYICQ